MRSPGPLLIRRAAVVAAVVASAVLMTSSARPTWAAPQAEETPTPAPEGQRMLVRPGPRGQTLEIAAGPGSILGKDELILKEYVDIKFGDTRLQADYVRYLPATKEAYAEGNVILDQGPARITAESLVYNLETGTGVFLKARGYAEPSFYFEAARIEKISENELVLTDATFTACAQPVPYWSFKIGHGLLRLEDYAYLRNLSFKVLRATVFYTPYLIWPLKTDRASGLLFPEFGFSRRGGTVISNAVYWAMRRNMDATFYIDYLSLAGYGSGLEYRYMPSASGKGYFTGYYIRDQVAKREQREGVPIDRWVINYSHNQNFGDDWRLVANANFVSDFDYYLDFERDIRRSTNPQAVSNLFLTRNRGFYSFNVRGERREQLLNLRVEPTVLGDPFSATEERAIVRWVRPEIEVRGRRQRLGRSPFFLSFESSLDVFGKGEENVDYGRFDIFPVLSSQLSPVPWLDIDASAGVRSTGYTKGEAGDVGCDGVPDTGDFGEGDGIANAETDANFDGVFDAADDRGCDNVAGTMDAGEGNGRLDRESAIITDGSLRRDIYQSGLTIIGPKLSRIFNRPNSTYSTKYKHTIEPQVRYGYQSNAEDQDRVIQFDEIDALRGSNNRITYALVSRLFARRPAGGLTSEGFTQGPAATYVGPGSDPFGEAREAARKERERLQAASPEPAVSPEEGAVPAPPPAPAEERLSTVEVATLEISQDYSFLGDLSRSSALDRSRPVSPLRFALRVNPSIFTSMDLRASYNVLFRDVSDASLSAHFRHPRRGFLDLTWSILRDLESRELQQQGLSLTRFDRNQVGFLGETSLFSRRLLFGMQANYELGDIGPGEPRLRDQRYKFGYNLQCCGLQFEVLNRNFTGTSQREFRFLVNLKGIGNVIDLQSGSGVGAPGPLTGYYQ